VPTALTTCVVRTTHSVTCSPYKVDESQCERLSRDLVRSSHHGADRPHGASPDDDAQTKTPEKSRGKRFQLRINQDPAGFGIGGRVASANIVESRIEQHHSVHVGGRMDAQYDID
jgi:hypothetical protein